IEHYLLVQQLVVSRSDDRQACDSRASLLLLLLLSSSSSSSSGKGGLFSRVCTQRSIAVAAEESSRFPREGAAGAGQQMLSKKRRRQEAPATHPRNRYAEKPPDFGLLASLYPSFQPFVFLSRAGRPTLDWTDFNATRELTRVLLHHDHGVQWWIPDGQLCPTVPNRSNYIHWIGDLLASNVIPRRDCGSDKTVRGFDIGTGTNCIYPLLGASLYGWSFVGSDVTDVALEWAGKNVENNPHLSHLIEIRNANAESFSDEVRACSEESVNVGDTRPEAVAGETAGLNSMEHCYHGPPILVGTVRDGEEFDFCMCNPPFFESIEEAGLNPKTSCGGTHQEMVCPGGERAFVSHIIDDSVVLKTCFRQVEHFDY
ncbi:hypothetical protein Taro_008790, partial [Colocasia esculenta]|nr:hypothetical protein [Colocasia esculenta]